MWQPEDNIEVSSLLAPCASWTLNSGYLYALSHPTTQQLLTEKKKTEIIHLYLLGVRHVKTELRNLVLGALMRGPIGSSWCSASPGNDCAQSSVFQYRLNNLICISMLSSQLEMLVAMPKKQD